MGAHVNDVQAIPGRNVADVAIFGFGQSLGKIELEFDHVSLKDTILKIPLPNHHLSHYIPYLINCTVVG